MGVDMLFILLLALILFGPKRLPEIARQIGKFVAEFKRASNDFKYQLQAEIDKASPDLSPQRQGAQQSSPSTPTLLPPPEAVPAASAAVSQHAEAGRAGGPDSEHERLMRTARMAYEAQAFTLRPPEPPPVARTQPSVPEQSSSAESVAVPSDSHSQSANTGQIGGPAPQGS